MALVSPGISISINDQSQLVNSNVGSVPLVILATAENKTYNGALATGTSAANAGQLLSFTSQRDLVTQMGTPTFQLSAAGTPVNGSEVNEYGLMAAYSALGLTNQLYAIRADIDLDQLTGTSVRPVSAPADGTYWLNTGTTNWGIYSTNATTDTFSAVSPLIITNPAQVADDNNFAYDVPTPLASVGSIGQYALVFIDDITDAVPSAIRLFYKVGITSQAGTNYTSFNNSWVQVGSSNWQRSIPAVTGTTALTGTPFASGTTITINGTTLSATNSAMNAAQFAAYINAAGVTGVYANATAGGYLQLFATSAATNGQVVVSDGTHTPLSVAGITAGTYNAPILFYGNFAQSPSLGWFSAGASSYNGYPTGSVWWKTTDTGSGFDVVLSQYSAAAGKFNTINVPAYSTVSSAIYGLDPIGGGINIPAGTTIAKYGVADTTSNNLRFLTKSFAGQTSMTSGTPGTFTATNSYTISVTQPGTSTKLTTTITLSSTTAATFVSDLLAANIPYITAVLNSNGTITITHTAGGEITLTNVSGTPLTTAGFTAGNGSGFSVNSILGNVYANGFTDITEEIEYQASTPYTAPASGTYWYYSNPTDVDIMINEVVGGQQGWYGYKNVSRDIRGYTLTGTDPNGVIISASQPTSHSDGTSLVPGDLWLDSSDLVNFPALSRVTAVTGGVATWTAIDNTDHVSANGIIFADARWDSTGTTDPITGSLPSISTLLTSNYIDQDAPDYRLYPRGTLLFNTRRSGYNVKKYVSDYFNSASFPNLPTVPGAASSLPTVKNTWVSASGLDSNGVMLAGSNAQRALVVNAMEAAIDSNLTVLEPTYQFNLIVAPGYPELIPNMLTLNTNRGNTAFVIGDTPLDLAPNTVDITNWVENNSGTGLPSDASSSPYLALYYPSGLTNDLSGNQIVVPASHAVLRTYLYNDQVSYPWFAPAGANRGLVSNLSDIGYIDDTTGNFVHNGVSQGLRDALFTLSINPITQLPGTGLAIWGQLTRSLDSTARNRVNVVRLENYLRTIFNSVANGYLFEPNDAITRKSIATQIEGSLNQILANRGLYDYLVICDTSNNTPATIANNQLYVDVAIEPMKDVEFIYIPIAIYNPGAIAALNTQSS